MSCLVILCATVIATTLLAGITYFYNQTRASLRRRDRYTPIARLEAPRTREEIVDMLERQFNNSPSGPPERKD